MTIKEKINLWAKGRLFELTNGVGEKDAESVLIDLLSFIDSLQEEPKFKVGQYLKQGDTIVKILEVSDDGYHCDNAFIPFSAQDQWELVKEPVSDDLEKSADKYSETIESYYPNCMFDRRQARSRRT